MTQYEDSRGQLHIMESEVLGKGGFGFVCRGDLMPEVRLWIVCGGRLISAGTNFCNFARK